MPFQETASAFQRTNGSSAGVFVATNAVRWNEMENREKLDYKKVFFSCDINKRRMNFSLQSCTRFSPQSHSMILTSAQIL